MKYVLALDEGTTSARAVLFDGSCNVISMAQREFTQIYPRSGWVEHNAVEIFAMQLASVTECVAKSGVAPSEIAAVGITNQRETTVVWDKHTGEPVCNAIVWQCRRTADICEDLIKQGLAEYVAEKTGLRIDAYFSGTKLKWILDNVPGVRERADRGDLLFGTVDCWLLWKLTGGKVHATDRTNASRTMLYDISADRWDDRLLEVLGIPACMLPELRSSSEIFGFTDIMGAQIPVCGIAGDQQSALFGQGCFNPGEAKNTYGTGCFLLANTGTVRPEVKNGLIATAAATCKGEPVQFAAEGSIFIGGAVIQWLRDELKIIEKSSESEKLALKTEDNGGVYLVPAFVGLGAPYWDMRARAAIFGMTRGSDRKILCRAALESIAYQTNDLLREMHNAGFPLTCLKADGGASQNKFLMQFQSDISNVEVLLPTSPEATALGAALLAGLAVGVWRDRAAIKEKLGAGTRYSPKMDEAEREKLLDGWKRAVSACRSFETGV
ncbi:MAG: glycerol kinase GlpK [Clostridia bacterium]|nr:glycerol kinase GlpK [Clostridia bacterium]